MITKIELNGFKTFSNFQMKFTPLTVIAGTNASGKSNLFDAFHLLSRLAEFDLKTAFSNQRGEAIELFTQYSDGTYASELSIAVEMLVDKEVRDNWGGEATLKFTRLRYELRLHRVKNEKGLDDLLVKYEHLEPIKRASDEWVKRYLPADAMHNWQPIVKAGRSKPFIYTKDANGTPTIKLPQDGRRGGKETPANAVAQTVLSGINSVDFPHAFAAKEELRNWRFLQLNPEALRLPSPYLAKDVISPDGGNLAAALHRVKTHYPASLKFISRKLSSLLPHFIKVDVFDDKPGKQYILTLRSEDGREFSSRVLSEGTLRLLTLCVLEFDDQFRGVICFEEPENGIHPYRISAMFNLLKDLTTDFQESDLPLRQIIVNTHSPILLNEVFKHETPFISCWFSQLVTRLDEIDGKRQKLIISYVLPVAKVHQPNLFQSPAEEKLSLNQVIDYLKSADFENTIRQLGAI